MATILMLATAAMAQKKNNGKIFDEHPGIELMHKFTEAYVAGDKATLEALLTDDFNGYNGLTTNKDAKGKDKQGLIAESAYWSTVSSKALRLPSVGNLILMRWSIRSQVLG